MNISRKFSAVLAAALLLFATSCVETVIVGTAAGGFLAVREKSVKKTGSDVSIASKLGSEFVAKGLKNPGNSVDITVNEGRVLLTGIVRDAQKAKLASELAWKVSGVKEVIDEIQLRDGDSIKGKDITTSFSDYRITWTIETKLLFGKSISSVNFKVTTVARTVYILGVAQDNTEMQKVIALASKVRGVEKVVNHIILVDDPRRR